jgi:hypothetical protein
VGADEMMHWLAHLFGLNWTIKVYQSDGYDKWWTAQKCIKCGDIAVSSIEPHFKDGDDE